MAPSSNIIRKPVTDSRTYRHITLGSNKLQALLISDPAADKSAAALDVQVGSLFDPPQAQGLAHFLEHMLFLGTRKYPAEDEYQSFLAKHGGMSNAFTADNHTCYFFNVAPEYLEGALDRFGQFFISPLFTQSATERELNAVNSEHSKNVQEDMWRQYQLMRTTCFHKGHPAHHFSTGNKETLGSVPREALLNFHKSWYSANVSRVAVLGKESLDDLEKLVTKVFSDVENKDVVVPLGTGFSEPKFAETIRMVGEGANVDTSNLKFLEHENPLHVPYGETGSHIPTINKQIIGKNLYIVPVKEQRSLQFCWFLPEQRRLWKSKPSRYLSHILGHEGPGSLTSVLKARGIATDLVAGVFYDNVGVSLMKLEIHLTKPTAEILASKQGDQQVNLLKEISGLVASYIKLARGGLSYELWKEMETVENLNFTFQPTLDPMTSVQTVVNAMHYMPVEEILAGSKMIYAYDQDAIRMHLDELTSDKMFMMTVGKEFAAERCLETEQWYGTKFGLHAIDPVVSENFARVEKNLDGPHSDLALPKPNPFLPENLDLKASVSGISNTVPSVLTKTVFYKQDDQFKMPKGHAAFAVYSPWMQQGGLEAYVKSDLLIQCLNEDFSQTAYQAEVAGLKYKLRTTREGFALSVGGYSDKVPEIAKQVVEQFRSFTPKEAQFGLVKDRAVRQLQSQLLQKAPYSQAIDLVHQVLLEPFYSIPQKLGAVLAVKSANELESLNKVLKDAYVESLIEGNFDRQDAFGLSKTVLEGISEASAPATKTVSRVKVMAMDDDVVVRRKGVNPNETNGAVVVSVEAGWIAGHVSESDETDLKTAALLSLTSQICGQKFFDDLRTKQQLGYIVHSAANIQERRAGLLFLVQSEVPAGDVQERMMAFINKFDETVAAITSEEFQEYVGAVVADLLEKPKNQEEEFQRHWAEIEKRRFDFGRKERLIPVVQDLSKDELVSFVKTRIIGAPKVIGIVTGSNDGQVAELLNDDEIAAVRSRARWVESNSRPIVNEFSSKM